MYICLLLTIFYNYLLTNRPTTEMEFSWICRINIYIYHLMSWILVPLYVAKYYPVNIISVWVIRLWLQAKLLLMIPGCVSNSNICWLGCKNYRIKDIADSQMWHTNMHTYPYTPIFVKTFIVMMYYPAPYLNPNHLNNLNLIQCLKKVH